MKQRKQAIEFQDAIGRLVDQFLREGMDPSSIRVILRDEAGSDLETRRLELEQKASP